MLGGDAGKTRLREKEVPKSTYNMNPVAIYAQISTNDFSFGPEHIDLRSESLQTVCYTWKQLKAATNNFDQANKLGEGGFGAVFKV